MTRRGFLIGFLFVCSTCCYQDIRAGMFVVTKPVENTQFWGTSVLGGENPKFDFKPGSHLTWQFG